MINASLRIYLSVFLVILVTASCAFSTLEDDLEKMDEVTHLFSGTLEAEGLASDSVVVVASNDQQGEKIAKFNLLYGSGPVEMLLSPAPTYFFGFNDLNKDLSFQRGEPFGWAANAEAVGPDDVFQIRIVVDASDPGPIPEKLVDQPLYEHLNDVVSLNIGAISALDNPLFSAEQATKGLWQPFAFMQDGGAGIHFLEDYDPNKIPVLFVHGIDDSPRRFAALIEQLDATRYQAWVYSYPSGLRLSWLAGGMAKFLETLNRKLQFDELHIVAHSMGGLVARGGINLCMQNSACSYLRSYTSISTPWNGVESARSGVKWAPTVVPVWRDLDPNSDYVSTLFETQLPNQMPYQLLFGYRQEGMFGSESSDGVIKLTSQLRQEAQDQAGLVRGYDEDHVGILSNPMVITQVLDILDGNTAN